jgi:anti-sigma factor RsiW
MNEHEWATQSIPWLVNGTLDERDALRLRAHLATCDECRRDMEIEQGLARVVAERPSVEASPHVSLAKLRARLDTKPRWFAAIFGREAGTRQLLAAGVAATLLLGVIVVASLTSRPQAEPTYKVASGEGPTAPHLQVVVDDKADINEVLTMLAPIKARVVGGPSSAGVYLVAIDASGDKLEAAAHRLEHDPRVRFVAIKQEPTKR